MFRRRRARMRHEETPMFRRDRREETRPALAEIVTPRDNLRGPLAMERALAGLQCEEPASLEIAATRRARWFLVRAEDPMTLRALERQLGAAYPQAAFRHLDLDRHPALDPARTGPHEQLELVQLRLRQPDYLPIQTFVEREAAASRRADADAADPLAGLLADLGDLPDGWRAVAQLVLRPAPPDWCRGYLPLAEEVRAPPPARDDDAGAALPVYLIAAMLALGTVGLLGYFWYLAGDWSLLALLLAGTLGIGVGTAWLIARLGRKTTIDPRLVREKVEGNAFRAELRVAVFAPSGVPADQVARHAERLAVTYHRFNRARSNGFVGHRISPAGCDLTCLRPVRSERDLPLLNVGELAGLWYLPLTADAPRLVEQTPLRHRLPLPADVALGCPIGVSRHQGVDVPVCLPDDTLDRHLVLVAKTRRGKSSLLLRLARYLMEGTGAERRAVVLVDPHGDLALAALGLVPPPRWGDVVYLDAAERSRPIGLNLLDVGLGWDRDKAVANALAIFRREFSGAWGPRMEDSFRFALLSLVEANETRVRDEVEGRGRQYTILDVPVILQELGFRRHVLERVADPLIHDWWARFDHVGHILQQESINPVQTKVQRFAGSRAARNIVGQPRSTVEPSDWLRSARIVIVNTAKGIVGEDTAALIGGTLINLVDLLVGEQAELRPAERRKVTLLVDELQATPGANYEALLSESAKFGANLILATQSLARIDALDRKHERALRPTLFANVDGILAFQTGDDDARPLSRELAGEVEPADLLNLPEYRCYAKLFSHGQPLPTFSVHLDPPPRSDEEIARRLAIESARQFGREVAEVTRSLQTARAEHQQDRAREIATVEAARLAAAKARKQDRNGGAQGRRSDHRNDVPYEASFAERGVGLADDLGPVVPAVDSIEGTQEEGAEGGPRGER
jgi:hypothetical protein